MKAIFLADAHLLAAGDSNYNLLEHFVKSLSEARERIDKFYILGDFFDFWFAKSARIYGEYERIVGALTSLRDAGSTVHLAEGNHEFFTREFFQTLEIETTEEHFDFTMDGMRFFVAHGDDYCGGVHLASLLKMFLKSEIAHILKGVLPLGLTWRLAKLFSQTSRRYSQQTGNEIVQGMQPAAERKFSEGYDVVIFGHSHFPAITEKLVDGRRKLFITLGDWLGGNSSYLCYDSGRFELKSCA